MDTTAIGMGIMHSFGDQKLERQLRSIAIGASRFPIEQARERLLALRPHEMTTVDVFSIIERAVLPLQRGAGL